MDTKQATYTALTETFGMIGQNVGPTIHEIIKDLGLAEIPGWGALLLATSIAPEPISVARLQVRGPYNAPQNQENSLKGLAEHGYLDAVEGGYVANDKAQEAIDSLLASQREKLETLPTLSESEGKELVALLDRVLDAIHAMDNTPCFDDATRRPNPGTLGTIENLVRHGSYLNAFRDDAHLGAWRKHDIDGHAWEIFTYIWRGEEMPEQLQQARGFSADDDAAANAALVEKGWVNADGTITDAGKTLRENVEVTTDDIFYSAFDVLSAEELDRVHNLLHHQKSLLEAVLQPADGEN